MASHCLFTSSRFVLKQPKYFILIYDFLFRYFNVFQCFALQLTSAYSNLSHFHFGLFLRFKSPPQSLYPCGRHCLSITSKDRALAIFTLERILGYRFYDGPSTAQYSLSCYDLHMRTHEETYPYLNSYSLIGTSIEFVHDGVTYHTDMVTAHNVPSLT